MGSQKSRTQLSTHSSAKYIILLLIPRYAKNEEHLLLYLARYIFVTYLNSTYIKRSTGYCETFFVTYSMSIIFFLAVFSILFSVL